MYSPGDRVRIIAKGATRYELGVVVKVKPGSIAVLVDGIQDPQHYIERDLELAEPSPADVT